jgi:Tol biopolymer transport system component
VKRLLGITLGVIFALAVAAPLAFGQDTGSVEGNKNSKIVFTQTRKDINDPICPSDNPYGPYICDDTEKDENLHAELWVMDDADGTELRQLTHNSTVDRGAEWSPNKDTIAFHGTQFKEDGITMATLPQIFVIPAASTATDDSTQTALTPEIQAPVNCNTLPLEVPCGAFFPSWSPKGDKIAFQDAIGRGTPPRLSIWVMDADGKNRIAIASGASRPDWTSNGNQIVFQSGRRAGEGVDNLTGDSEIFVMNADGSGTPIQLTNNTFIDVIPTLAPDDSKMVFLSDRDHLGESIQIGGVSQPLNELYVMDLTRDPTSGNITGASNPSNPTRLTKCTWNPVTETCAEPAGSPRNLDPDWSPNGKEIAFHRHITSDNPRIRLEDNVLEIFVMDAKDDDGNGQSDNLKQLTQLPSENSHPGWSPK